MPTSSVVSSVRLLFVTAILLLPVACKQSPPPAPPTAPPSSLEAAAGLENGAISVAPIAPEPDASKSGRKSGQAKLDWSPVELASGHTWVGCSLDYAGQGDGERLPAMDRKTLEAALGECVDRGVLRLRYKGRIAADFATLIERVARVADGLKIGKRVLDLDSAGGQVEDAIRAGDVIADSRWTVWVREDSVCHSACVLVLSGGDVRHLAGRIGIHRIIRMSSTATTRAELNAELKLVYDRVRDYLERNGTSTAVADLMKAVPNRSLRVLTDEELQRFGLEGINSAQDDLDRLRLQRECGEDFVARRDAFARAFDLRCRGVLSHIDDQNDCGLALRGRFGFPDASCPAESPLSEFDLGQAEPEPAKPAAEEAVVLESAAQEANPQEANPQEAAAQDATTEEATAEEPTAGESAAQESTAEAPASEDEPATSRAGEDRRPAGTR